jgi:hypothetical protein
VDVAIAGVNADRATPALSAAFRDTRPGRRARYALPVADRGQAIAVAQGIALDIPENMQDCLGKGNSVSVVDDEVFKKEFGGEPMHPSEKGYRKNWAR